MTQQVDFYILGKLESTAKFKYACRVAQKAYLQGLTVYLHTESQQQNSELDMLLWTFSQGSFVPHIIADNAMADWQQYPVQLGDTLDNVENDGADTTVDLLISLISDPPRTHSRFNRIVDLVTDFPEQKASGRRRFRYYREQGIEPNTHTVT
jgi:DNA polymerase-3 subunit chi